MASRIAAYTALGRAGLPEDFDLPRGRHGLLPSLAMTMWRYRALLVRCLACSQRPSFAM
jgi:hypothetical protein